MSAQEVLGNIAYMTKLLGAAGALWNVETAALGFRSDGTTVSGTTEGTRRMEKGLWLMAR